MAWEPKGSAHDHGVNAGSPQLLRIGGRPPGWAGHQEDPLRGDTEDLPVLDVAKGRWDSLQQGSWEVVLLIVGA